MTTLNVQILSPNVQAYVDQSTSLRGAVLPSSGGGVEKTQQQAQQPKQIQNYRDYWWPQWHYNDATWRNKEAKHCAFKCGWEYWRNLSSYSERKY